MSSSNFSTATKLSPMEWKWSSNKRDLSRTHLNLTRFLNWPPRWPPRLLFLAPLLLLQLVAAQSVPTVGELDAASSGVSEVYVSASMPDRVERVTERPANETAPVGEQHQHKSEPSAPTAPTLSQREDTVAEPVQTQEHTTEQEVAVSTERSRPLKSGFAGYLGVFGRKRSQWTEDKKDSGQQEQEHTPSPSTRPPPGSSSTSRMRVADYPDDYRQMLFEPEQAELQRQTQESAQQQQQQQQDIEEPVVQQASSEPEWPVPELPTTPVDQQQSEETQAPYIRLSNIATINSTSISSGNTSAEMKLMRIYVIDLDQKLVVGGSSDQSGAQVSTTVADSSISDQASNYTTTTTKAATPVQAAQVSLAQPQQHQQDSKHEIKTSQVYLNVYPQEMYQEQRQQPAVESKPIENEPAPAVVYDQPEQLLHQHYQQEQQQNQQLHQQQQQQPQHNEPNNYAKVTTSALKWKPLDYPAPSAIYSHTAAHANHQAPDSGTIKPAQFGVNGYQTVQVVAGLSDHHVVSPNSLFAGQQPDSAGPSQQLRPANNKESPVLYSYDVHHAPLNYQEPRKSLAHDQPAARRPSGGGGSAYVNTSANYPESGSSTYHSSAVHAQPNDAPSQQVPNGNNYASKHPSWPISGYQYSNNNGTGSQNAPSAEVHEYGQQQLQQPAKTNSVTNEAPVANGVKNKLFMAGAQPSHVYSPVQESSSQHQYGTHSLAAYAIPKSHPDQSSAPETPKIPHPQPANSYRPLITQSVYKQHQPPSAYLSVSGPPVSDGSYESEDNQRAPSHPAAAAKHHQAGPKPPRRTPHKPARPPKQQKHHQRHHQQDKPPKLYPQAELQQDIPASPAYQVPGGNYPSRPAPSNYYQPVKGLLSWETISSVASGAAKRLPSLSSFLSPFAGNAPPRPFPNYQHYPESVKSAHYDRDVANFHRPYPLRHINHPNAAYTDEGIASGKHHDLGAEGSSQLGSDEFRPDSDEEDAPGKLGANLTNGSDSRPALEVIDMGDLPSDLERPPPLSLKPRRPGRARPAHIASEEGEPEALTPESDLDTEAELPRRQPRRRKKVAAAELVDSAPLLPLEPMPEPATRPLIPSVRRPHLATDSSPYDDVEELRLVGAEQSVSGGGGAPSMQIGQYRITPQTQFVHNIIEPSRQMLGNMFKQYIGQLGQLGNQFG